jgi:uncharacterized protein (DUF4415 family)
MAGDAQKTERQDKKRICIRIDTDLLDFFRKEAAKTVHSENPSGYQGLLNEALREYLDTREYLDRMVRDKQYTDAPN